MSLIDVTSWFWATSYLSSESVISPCHFIFKDMRDQEFSQSQAIAFVDEFNRSSIGSSAILKHILIWTGPTDISRNPCYTGNHGCDTNAVCRPGTGNQFTCECSVGFQGDGRVCYGMKISLYRKKIGIL